MNTQGQFTKEYFFSQVAEFRELFGSKPFWDGPEEKRSAALKGLTFVYTNVKTETEEDEDRIQMIFQNAVEEFVRRQTMITTMLLRKLVSR